MCQRWIWSPRYCKTTAVSGEPSIEWNTMFIVVLCSRVKSIPLRAYAVLHTALWTGAISTIQRLWPVGFFGCPQWHQVQKRSGSCLACQSTSLGSSLSWSGTPIPAQQGLLCDSVQHKSHADASRPPDGLYNMTGCWTQVIQSCQCNCKTPHLAWISGSKPDV